MTAETREHPDLKGFAEDVMRCWPEGDVDCGDLQHMALRHGLIAPETRTQPCAEDCYCVVYGAAEDDEWTCYRRVPL
jgi:hypothetical protein